MNPIDKINKSSWTLNESIKDALVSNVVSAVKSKQFKIEPTELDKLLKFLKASVDEGYSKAHRSFMKSVESALKE